jgi:hypothetical protein
VTGSAKIAGVALPSPAAPIKLKLQRTGQVITVSYSTDGGTTWLPSPAKTQDFGSATGAVAFDGTVYVGLVGVSGVTTATSTAVFDSVSLSLP